MSDEKPTAEPVLPADPSGEFYLDSSGLGIDPFAKAATPGEPEKSTAESPKP
jgi:hypothetical protein